MRPAELERTGSSRRDFLKSAGVLIVGFSMAGKARKLAGQTQTVVDGAQVDSWIAIADDESIANPITVAIAMTSVTSTSAMPRR